MKVHNLEAIGHLRLNYTPTAPDHAVRLSDLTALSSAGAPPVFITRVEPVSSGNVGSKQFADTIPANQVLLSCVSDTTALRIHFLAESGSSFYNPTVTVDGGAPDSFSEVPDDRRMYIGYKDVVVDTSREVQVVSSTGAVTSVSIVMADAGPEIASLEIGDIPFGQTAVKQNDNFAFSGTVANAATDVNILNVGAAVSGTVSLGAIDSGGEGLRAFSGTAKTSSRTGNLSLNAQAVNSLNTAGNAFPSSNTVLLDQVVPTIDFSVVSIAGGYDAIGQNGSAEVSITITGQDSQSFNFAHGDAGGPLDEYLQTRTLSVSGEVYSLSGGVTITAARSTNGTSASRSFTVPVASKPAVASVTVDGSVVHEDTRQVTGYPRSGSSQNAVNSAAGITALATEAPSTDNQMFMCEAGFSEFGWFAYPAALGTATFLALSSGTPGGWDGASWPLDGSIGEGTGPITVQKDGVDWYVYRTDAKGAADAYSVTFQNPGLEVGGGGPIAHIKTSDEGLTYTVNVVFDQKIDSAPTMTPSVGTWASAWTRKNSTTWRRDLTVDNSMPRGNAEFGTFSATNEGGIETTELASGKSYALAGFDKITVTFPAFARLAPIGVAVFNASNTSANYAGSADPLTLRTDNRDAQGAYSIVDSEGNYAPTNGTHLWLSDANFAASNTSGTLQVEIEENL